MKRIALTVLACLLLLSSCNEPTFEPEDAVSASVTEYLAPETTVPETEAQTDEVTLPPPEITNLEEVLPRLPASLIAEVSERISELYDSYTRTTVTATEILRGGVLTRSEFSSELKTNAGNASFRRTADGGDEEYFLIDGFLCYGGEHGNYRFGGYNIPSFSALAGNHFTIEAFAEGEVLQENDCITLKFDKLTDSGLAEIANMLSLPEEYALTVTVAEFIFVTDSSVNMKEKRLTLEATVALDGEEILSFALTSRTEQTGIGEENDLTLPALTAYTLVESADALALYEAALADIESFFDTNEVFALNASDDIVIDGASALHLTEALEHAYAKKIGASIERSFNTAGNAAQTRVLTHYNHRRSFSQINGGSIFVDSTLNKNNLEENLTEPLRDALLPFSAFARIGVGADGALTVTLGTEGKEMLAREILLAAGIVAESVKVTSADEALLRITFDADGRIASITCSFSAHVTADGSAYTLSRTRRVNVTSRTNAKVKVIYIDVEDEEEEEE